MTKLDFLNALERGLQQLPQEERERHLSYYSEMLDDMIEDGTDEEQAVATLGDAGALAGEILRETSLPVLVKSRVKPQKGWDTGSIVFMILCSPIWIPVSLVLLSLVLTVYICIWSVFIALFAVAAGILVSGAALIAAPWFAAPAVALPDGLLMAGGGLIVIGLGILAVLGVLAVGKGLVRLTGLFARWIRSLFIKKEAAH